MELLERKPYLAQLHELLAGAGAGEGGLVLLSGEAGVGKSTVVRAFCRESSARARVLTGACDPLSTPQPLGPLLDIAAMAGGELLRLLREATDRVALFGACLRELSASPNRRPTLTVIEDVHWADEATLDLLRYLGRRLRGTSGLLLVTYRDDEVGPTHPLRLVLGDLASAGRPKRIVLQPLSQDALRQMTSGTSVDPKQLHRLTGGNPFFVTEILAAGTTGIPATVQDAVLARAARLSPAGRGVLDAAAVLGASINMDELMTVAQVGATEVGECLDRGLLQPEGVQIAFRHELARRAIEGAIVPPRSVELHRRALAALLTASALDTDLARIAHHAEAAGDSDAVLEFAPRAAERAAALRANREAAAQHARAVRFATGLPPERREPLLWASFHASYSVSDSANALSAIGALREIARTSGDPRKEAEVRSWFAMTLMRDGRNPQAETESAAAVQALADLTPGSAHVIAYLAQGYLRMLDRDCVDAIAWAERTYDLAMQLGDSESAIITLNTMGAARILNGEEDRGRAELERSIEMATDSGMDALVANGYTNLGSAFGEVFNLNLAERYLTEGIAYSERRDLDASGTYMLAWLGLVRCYQGQWTEATARAEEVLRRPHANAISRIMALIALGRVRARRGDPDVMQALDAALEIAGPTGTLQRVGPVHAARAEAAWLAGDSARTAAEAEAAYQIALDHHQPWLTGDLAYWLWRSGMLTEGSGEVAKPYRLQIAGDWAVAAEMWDAIGCPYETARALADADAELPLRRALTIFEGLGARPGVIAVTRRLRSLGFSGIPRGPRLSTRIHPANLTHRETEVLDLVAEGQTNGEIAAHLFVSIKTVEHHVSSILSKLDVGNRAEAVRAARRFMELPKNRSEEQTS